MAAGLDRDRLACPASGKLAFLTMRSKAMVCSVAFLGRGARAAQLSTRLEPMKHPLDLGYEGEEGNAGQRGENDGGEKPFRLIVEGRLDDDGAQPLIRADPLPDDGADDAGGGGDAQRSKE